MVHSNETGRPLHNIRQYKLSIHTNIRCNITRFHNTTTHESVVGIMKISQSICPLKLVSFLVYCTNELLPWPLSLSLVPILLIHHRYAHQSPTCLTILGNAPVIFPYWNEPLCSLLLAKSHQSDLKLIKITGRQIIDL